MRSILCAAAVTTLLAMAPQARAEEFVGPSCAIPAAVVANLQGQLAAAVQGGNGGFFSPNQMWSAIVDRKGRVCSVISSSPDAWPGSRAIAMAKAFTANAFSNNQLALSTAELYHLTQPGGSLYGLNNSNPFNPLFETPGTGLGYVAGGIITFGGGLALYQNGQIIGGLGISGDTACADHNVAWKMRAAAGLNVTPIYQGGGSDNIVYGPGGHPSCTGNDKPPT